MKTIYTFTKLMMVILAGALFLIACSKSQAEPEPDIIRNFPIQSPDSSSVGSITVTEAANGEARVTIQLNTAMLASYTPPFQPLLRDQREILSYLKPLNDQGVSETSPVMSVDKNLSLSYDLLLRTKDLEVQVLDAEERIIARAVLR